MYCGRDFFLRVDGDSLCTFTRSFGEATRTVFKRLLQTELVLRYAKDALPDRTTATAMEKEDAKSCGGEGRNGMETKDAAGAAGCEKKRQVKQASQHGEEEMKRRRWVVRVRSGRLKMARLDASRLQGFCQ